MLSPKLLDLLTAYWWAENPKGWLFPARVPGEPVTRACVEVACRKAWRRSGPP